MPSLLRPRCFRMVILGALLACGGETTEPEGPLALTVVTADSVGTVGEVLPVAPRVRVTDGSGNPRGDVVVHWVAQAGRLSDSVSRTAPNGEATIAWTLGTVSGSQQLTASIAGVDPVTFTTAALPGAPVSLTITPATDTLEPRATVQLSATGADGYGNAILPTQVTWTSDASVVAAVSASGQLTTARAGTAHVRASVGPVTSERAVVVRVHWTAVGAGRKHTCALDAMGYAFCWGTNDLLQLGATGIDWSGVPVPVGGTYQFTQLVVGRDHACGMTDAHNVYCWGDNASGELGIGSLTPAAVAMPTAVSGSPTLVSLAANDGVHMCGVSDADAAFCWGWEGEGELGNGKFMTFVGEPSPQTVLGDLRFASLVTGESHTCGLTPSGAPYCWGNDYSGQVGDGDRTSPLYRPQPTPVAGGLSFQMMAAGGEHSCGLTADGAVYCWGGNSVGQAGSSNVGGYAFAPQLVASSVPFARIAASENTTCALTSAGAAQCWGDNSNGKIGDGTTTNRTAPTPVATTALFTQLSVGWNHTCGLTADSRIFCWGANDRGQLGVAPSPMKVRPIEVSAPQ
ncbi:MAG TPA: Ig-like domain-containing protein [Gemmatimonadaceae bacterium]